jgi:hypothetical protein
MSKTVRHTYLTGSGQDLSSADIEKIAAAPYEVVERAVIERGHWEKGSAKPLVKKQSPVPAKERDSHAHLFLKCIRMLEYDLLPRNDETADRVKTLREAVNKWLSNE